MKITLNELRQLVKNVIKEEMAKVKMENEMETEMPKVEKTFANIDDWIKETSGGLRDKILTLKNRVLLGKASEQEFNRDIKRFFAEVGM
jgi:hypothetical protein